MVKKPEKNGYDKYLPNSKGDRLVQNKKIEDKISNMSKYETGSIIIPCKFGCQAQLYLNQSVSMWYEIKSNIWHTKQRCQQIKQRRLQEAQNDNSKRRADVIEEMIIFLQTNVPPHANTVEKIARILETRKVEEDAVTIDELSLAINPEKILFDDEGNKVPSTQGLAIIANALHKLRKLEDNNSIASFATRQKNNIWYYFNLQTTTEYEPVKSRLQKTVEGTTETIEKFDAVTKMTVKERTREEKNLNDYFRAKELGKPVSKEEETNSR
jgi:hypothetical protein